MELGGDDSQVIDNDDGNAHVARQMPQQARVGIKAASRTADANDGKVIYHSVHARSVYRAGPPTFGRS
jgi:hypothetical protein